MNKMQQTKQQDILSLAHYTYQKALHSYAYFKVSDHSVGDDLVQDTFLKTWKYLIKGGKITLMKSFLYHVLNGLIIDTYRKKKYPSLDKMLENGYESGTDDTEHLFNFSDGEAAVVLIKKLPSPYKKVIHMRYVQDLSLDEMSGITGQTKNTVAVQVHRGMEKLRVLYNHKAVTINTN